MIRARRGERGLTLIEVTTAVTILAICASLLAPMMLAVLEGDRLDETKEEMAILADALLAYYGDTLAFPAEPRDLWENSPAVAGWKGPYVSPSLNDPLLRVKLSGADTDFDSWAMPYVFVPNGIFSRKIRSYGPNRALGGGDDVEKVVDVNAFLREITRGELVAINRAIYLYNLDSLFESPLAPPWANVRATLQAEGYLPVVSDYDTDGWGQSYVVSGPPVMSATSAGAP